MLALGSCSGWRATETTGCRPRQFWQRPAHSAATEPGTSAAPASPASVSSASVAASSCATVASSSAMPIRSKVMEHLQQAHWVGSSLTANGGLWQSQVSNRAVHAKTVRAIGELVSSKLTLAPRAGNPEALCPCCIGFQSPADGTRVSAKQRAACLQANSRICTRSLQHFTPCFLPRCDGYSKASHSLRTWIDCVCSVVKFA